MNVPVLQSNSEISGKNIDHHGLVASIFHRLNLKEKIDQQLPSNDPRRRISSGEAVLAFIINGLGFSSRRLYLSPQFFQGKPIEALFGRAINPEDINDHSLGRTLDEIYEYGPSRWFSEIALQVGFEQNLIDKVLHLDSSSFCVQGAYDSHQTTGAIQITHGYSKDQRPDLLQFMINLIVSGANAYPVICNPKDGNASDHESFIETRNFLSQLLKELGRPDDFLLVMDGAFYSAPNLARMKTSLWISRVPERINEAKALIVNDSQELDWAIADENYSYCTFFSHYGQIPQRWILVHSKHAFNREKDAFDKKLQDSEEELKKALWHLGNQVFGCAEDAEKELKKITKKQKYFTVEHSVVSKKVYAERGRPKKDQPEVGVVYQIQATLHQNLSAIAQAVDSLGRFILATNEMDEAILPSAKVLEYYKGQQNVERGFAFIKDSTFLVNSVFLKSNRRIEALAAIMCLCLLIYSVGQFWVREGLAKANLSIPSQKNKPTQSPTLKWIFQCFEGLIELNIQNPQAGSQRLILNINQIHKTVIALLGPTCCQIYGFP